MRMKSELLKAQKGYEVKCPFCKCATLSPARHAWYSGEPPKMKIHCIHCGSPFMVMLDHAESWEYKELKAQEERDE